MIYLGYCTSGQEFAVEERLRNDGFDVWCGKTVVFPRGSRRRARVEDWRIVPRIPNYLFLSLEDDDWHRLHSRPRKHLAATKYALRRDDERELQRFRKASEAEMKEGMDIVRRQDRTAMCDFVAGQRVIALSGHLEGVAGTFRRLVEEGGALLAEVEMQMFGGYAPVRFPLVDVKGETV